MHIFVFFSLLDFLRLNQCGIHIITVYTYTMENATARNWFKSKGFVEKVKLFLFSKKLTIRLIKVSVFFGFSDN